MYLHETKAALKAVVALAQAQIEQLVIPEERYTQMHALAVVEQHLADLDCGPASGLSTLVEHAREGVVCRVPLSAEESQEIADQKVAIENEIRLAMGCTRIVRNMLDKYGVMVAEDEEINGVDAVDDLAEWLTAAQAVLSLDVTDMPVQVFQGYLKMGSEMVQVCFHAPIGSSVAEKDAAMMAALAQKVDFDYVSIGETEREALPGEARMELQDVTMSDVVGDYDTPDEVPEWKWVEDNASYRHVENGQSGIWEFMLNMSLTFNDVPERLTPVLDAARRDNVSYLVFHQGT